MATLAEIRQSYPQYSDMSDADLASALHQKFYSDMPRADFDKRIGLVAPVSTLEDAVKSGGSGVVRGAAMIAGTGGDLSKMMGAGTDKLKSAGVPVDQMKADALGAMPSWLRKYHEKSAPQLGSQEIMGSIDRAAGAPITAYEPKTTAGAFARTTGEFVPMALMGGGGLLRGAVLPGVMSEGAGQLTKDTALETPARIAAALVAPAVPRMASDALGVLGTGTGGQSVRTAFESGVRGGETGKAFRDNMRGNVPIDDVVTDARTAVGNMRAERGRQYESGMKGVRSDSTVLDFSDIDAAVAKANNVKTFKGQELSDSTKDVREQIAKKIGEWKALDPKEYHTPAGLDALKQSIGDIKDGLPFNTPQRVVADQVYNSIRQTVAKQAPEYANTMQGYQKASDAISEIERTLSVNRKASVDTTLRKLQSVTRNNVNTNYGKRADLVEALAQNGAPNLMEKLSGQTMNTWMPRGLNKLNAAPVAAAASFLNPAALAALPFMSPRIVGEAAHLAGRASGALGAPARSVRKAIGANQYPQIDQKRAAILSALIASRQ